MQQPTSRQLYAYWDKIRNGRIAPPRLEIEPGKIAAILRETFIAECNGLLAFRFRLAGTRVCQQFCRELRGVDFLSLWSIHDRDAIASLARNIVKDGAVGHGIFLARTETDRQAAFEFMLLPLIHTGPSINRMLGSITAIEPPFWLGAEPLISLEITELHLHWPDGVPAFMAAGTTQAARRMRGHLRVVEGGLSRHD
jgi:hypothetical protein